MIEDLRYEITEEERSRRLAAVYRLLIELGQENDINPASDVVVENPKLEPMD